MVKKGKSGNLNETTREVGKFSMVGVLNTLIDFGIYNLLTVVMGFALIAANLVSTTVAMSFSFIANKTFVFGSRGGNVLKQAILFLLVTAFGLYVIQNAIIYSLVEFWQWPLDFAYTMVELLKLDGVFSREFVVANGAKALASIISLVWNYILYKKVVFREGKVIRA
ncbi:MAG: GtrA family protein [Candidatus Saccharimonadales bacterium]